MLGFHQHSLSLELAQHVSSMREEVFIEEEIFKALLKENNEIFFCEFSYGDHPKPKKKERKKKNL